jgi:magnesium transporter
MENQTRLSEPDHSGDGSSVVSTTALAFATKRVPLAHPDETVSEILRQLSQARRFDSMADVAVVQNGRLVGMIPIEELFTAHSDLPASKIMDPDPPVIGAGVDQEAAAAKAVSHEESSIGVTSADGRFLGLIPPHRMLGVLLEEHREDMARASGFLHQSSSARAASEESLPRRFWHRFPWLLVGLAAAMAAAVIVAGFEQGLGSHLELVFFIPGIVYIADAVGTQTETLVVRGLSVGIPVGNVMRREIITGIALGAVLGGLAYPLVLMWFGSDVALTVAASICAASTVATGVAMSLPWLLSRVGLDPAFGSGPLSTVVQDLLSLTIYFAFASSLVL